MNGYEPYKNSIAAALIELDLHHIKRLEAIAVEVGDFRDLKEVYKAEAAVDKLLHFIEKM